MNRHRCVKFGAAGSISGSNPRIEQTTGRDGPAATMKSRNRGAPSVPARLLCFFHEKRRQTTAGEKKGRGNAGTPRARGQIQDRSRPNSPRKGQRTRRIPILVLEKKTKGEKTITRGQRRKDEQGKRRGRRRKSQPHLLRDGDRVPHRPWARATPRLLPGPRGRRPRSVRSSPPAAASGQEKPRARASTPRNAGGGQRAYILWANWVTLTGEGEVERVGGRGQGVRLPIPRRRRPLPRRVELLLLIIRVGSGGRRPLLSVIVATTPAGQAGGRRRRSFRFCPLARPRSPAVRFRGCPEGVYAKSSACLLCRPSGCWSSGSGRGAYFFFLFVQVGPSGRVEAAHSSGIKASILVPIFALILISCWRP